jgi:hypothetical protein
MVRPAGAFPSRCFNAGSVRDGDCSAAAHGRVRPNSTPSRRSTTRVDRPQAAAPALALAPDPPRPRAPGQVNWEQTQRKWGTVRTCSVRPSGRPVQ